MGLNNKVKKQQHMSSHNSLNKNTNTEVNLKILFLGLFASWLILMVGVQIVHFKFKEGQFINRFLMATVFQILAFLGLAELTLLF